MGDADTVAMQVGDQIYLRQSSSTLVSDIVHEGTHALDVKDDLGNISTWDFENHAYISEYDFQTSLGQVPQFSSIDEIDVHIALNYKKR